MSNHDSQVEQSTPLARSKGTVPRATALGIVILLLHVFLLAYMAHQDSPTYDEVAHLPAGVSIWKYNTFEIYQVNPPLVRMVAAIPVMFTSAAKEFEPRVANNPRHRSEFKIGIEFFKANASKIFWLFTMARWACIPFSLVGAIVCWRWGSELSNAWGGLLSLGLWCISPMILGHGHLITADVAGASFAVAATYLFWKWLEQPSLERTIFFGITLGLALLTKFTLVLLPILLTFVWIAHLDSFRRAWKERLQELGKLTLAYVLALLVVNLGYGFEDPLVPLGKHPFYSKAFTGSAATIHSNDTPQNRWANSWLGQIPSPLPQRYLTGIDLQKCDFEMQLNSYLRGEWRSRGWWYYYAYGLAIKETVGLFALLLIAFAMGFSTIGRYSFADLILLLMAGAFLMFVSLHLGFNHHIRYAMPVLPFLFVFASKAALLPQLFPQKEQEPTKRFSIIAGAIPAGIFAYAAISSLLVFPHSLSYFNELVGGPRYGLAHLDNSNIDWGQDLLYLKRWSEEKQIKLDGVSNYLQQMVQMTAMGFPKDEVPTIHQLIQMDEFTKDDYWFAVGANNLIAVDQGHSYLKEKEPFARIGYSIYVYRLTQDELKQIRQQPLPSPLKVTTRRTSP